MYACVHQALIAVPMQKAAELETAHQEGKEAYELGCKLYSRGKYVAAEQNLSQALDECGALLKLTLVVFGLS